MDSTFGLQVQALVEQPRRLCRIAAPRILFGRVKNGLAGSFVLQKESLGLLCCSKDSWWLEGRQAES
jgi:hypothetical protein